MRTVGSNGEVTENALREAGIKLISKHGYEAVTLRALATEVGIQAGSLYNYIQNKQEFLFRLLIGIMEELLAELDVRLAGLKDPRDRLQAFIALHIEFHTRRKNEVFIGNMELRSLLPKHRAKVVALRADYEQKLCQIIRDGRAQGLFKVSDEIVASYAIIAMLTGVCNWYRPNGRLNIEKLTEIHSELVFGSLGAPLKRKRDS
jgi:AcrR family transcriptional regulator